jgi:Ca-activated chloride channel family protein
MRYKSYSKYIPELADAINLEELIDELSDFLLQSGFAGGPHYHPFWGDFGTEGSDHSLDSLRQAIMDALINSGKLTPEMLQVLRGDSTGDEDRDGEIQQQLADLIDQILQRLVEEGPPADVRTRRSGTFSRPASQLQPHRQGH